MGFFVFTTILRPVRPHTRIFPMNSIDYDYTTQMHTIPPSGSTNTPTAFSPSPFSSESHLDRLNVALGVEVESGVDCEHDAAREEEGYTRGHDGIYFA